ncbi:hypothetical protein GUITHDRAFT_157724 [Guillardia theta CCMP2712]|uniref:Uncharacterized protein n=1 Tax=Guillardia theta (strain CCMP2712) TaxID=905079 RepID=L1JFC8_GUITC|nr:hypothetical protein GUITHDRAFT_157724 [Guillardia theta CCMP2712]EKX46780.1 hypothetical protein GUITHDRAFT_157724 [Guillardia theta CCMP2712]|eukprot:XP_005833760.1 hypothetical protein GUITHDRAFT_157724 [Guillardia theta CCMP2712]
MVGSALCKSLEADGLEIVPIRRVHLAGENVATGSGPLGWLGIQAWSEAKKSEIIKSRKEGTEAVVEAINACPAGKKPKTLVCASGVGFYGYTTEDAVVDESSPMGTGFLAAEVCPTWEAAASQASCRVVIARLAPVLSNNGGALGKLLPIFNLGGGGIVGSGKQYFSWISLRDCVKGIRYMIDTPSLSGPVNLCSPQPVTNADFTSALGKALQRPTILPFPDFAVRLLFGQMGEEMLLGGQRAMPSKLQAAGFQFQDNTIDEALAATLK